MAAAVVVGLQRQYLHAVAGDGDMDDILLFFHMGYETK